MAKSREGKGSEYYLGIIRKLKSENRNLKKRLKQLERREHFHYDEQIEDDIPELPIGEKNEKLRELCGDCGKGFLEEIEIVGRFFKKCNVCEFRTKAIKL